MNYVKFPLLGVIGLLFLTACAHTNKSAHEKAEAEKQAPPKLTKPVARRIWIEPQILENGSVYVDGHWKYIIHQESTWTK